MSKDFDAMSEQERNEAVARALGWKRHTVSEITNKMMCRALYKKQGYFWTDTKGRDLSNPLDWQGDDGLAFKELWPEIIMLNPLAVIGMSHSRKVVDCSTITTKIIYDGTFSGDTWAHVICKAFLVLNEGE